MNYIYWQRTLFIIFHIIYQTEDNSNDNKEVNCMANGVLGNIFGGESSLLFFFLLLVIIFFNCDIFRDSGDELLFFFLLLVVLFSGNSFWR